ncbi:hypothetical protein FOPE_02437 [Fonsecaea pedrosoi]|nr:hypothetical protein FOPE_02437 [Fonsecaea pedrosoi]
MPKRDVAYSLDKWKAARGLTDLIRPEEKLISRCGEVHLAETNSQPDGMTFALLFQEGEEGWVEGQADKTQQQPKSSLFDR